MMLSFSNIIVLSFILIIINRIIWYKFLVRLKKEKNEKYKSLLKYSGQTTSWIDRGYFLTTFKDIAIEYKQLYMLLTGDFNGLFGKKLQIILFTVSVISYGILGFAIYLGISSVG